VETLVRNGADINQQINLEVFMNIKEFSLKAGTEIPYAMINGSSPLTFALMSEDTKILQTVLKNGADVNLQSSGGFTPMMVAAFMGQLEAIKTLYYNSTTDVALYSLESAAAIAEGKNHSDIVYFLRELDTQSGKISIANSTDISAVCSHPSSDRQVLVEPG
jgi:ankyrin repeat protein